MLGGPQVSAAPRVLLWSQAKVKLMALVQLQTPPLEPGRQSEAPGLNLFTSCGEELVDARVLRW